MRSSSIAGILALRTGAHADAIQALEPLASRITDLPMQALARRALGIAHYELGRYDQAERQFRLVGERDARRSRRAGSAPAWRRWPRTASPRRRTRSGARATRPPTWRPPPRTASSSSPSSGGTATRSASAGPTFVDRFPRHAAAPAVLYGLVAAALERKDLAEGQAWAQRLLREHAASDLGTHALLRLAAAAETTRPDVARQAYRDLLTRSTTTEIRADASFGLAEAALAAGDGGEAQRAVEGFLREVPAGDPRAVRATSSWYGPSRRRGSGTGRSRRSKASCGSSPATRRARARASTRPAALRGTTLGRSPAVLRGARRADDPAVAAEAEFWLGEALRARGEHEAAIGAYLAAQRTPTRTRRGRRAVSRERRRPTWPVRCRATRPSRSASWRRGRASTRRSPSGPAKPSRASGRARAPAPAAPGRPAPPAPKP